MTERRVVLITGASSGIGAALAKAYARGGGSVAILGRRADRLERVAHEINGSGATALPIVCDVTRDEDVSRAIETTLARFGQLDVAIANAGFPVTGLVHTLTLDDFRRQFETNVYGVLRVALGCRQALMQRHGRLAIIGSMVGFLGSPEVAPYAMSKAAVRVLANTLRNEWREIGVSVTHVAPGYVESEIRQVDNAGVFHAETPDLGPKALIASADATAKAIVRALDSRKKELFTPRSAMLMYWMTRFFPTLVDALTGKRELPKAP